MKSSIHRILVILSVLLAAPAAAQENQTPEKTEPELFTRMFGVLCNTMTLAQRVVERTKKGVHPWIAVGEVNTEVGTEGACWYRSYVFAFAYAFDDSGNVNQMQPHNAGTFGKIRLEIWPVLIPIPVAGRRGGLVTVLVLQYAVFPIAESGQDL